MTVTVIVTVIVTATVCRDKDGVSVVNPQELAGAVDVRSKSCMRGGDHGSPVSNRSVSFATCGDEISNSTKVSKKQKKRRDKLKDMERAERLSLRSLDTMSNCSGEHIIPSISKRSSSDYGRSRASPDTMPALSVSINDKSNIAHPENLTEVDVDKPQFSTLVIKKTIHSGGGNNTSLTEGKVLCNILEDKRLDSRESFIPSSN